MKSGRALHEARLRDNSRVRDEVEKVDQYRLSSIGGDVTYAQPSSTSSCPYRSYLLKEREAPIENSMGWYNQKSGSAGQVDSGVTINCSGVI